MGLIPGVVKNGPLIKSPATLPGSTQMLVLSSTGVMSTQEITSGTNDHGALNGLSDDDHTQYVLANGSRPITGNLNVSGIIRSTSTGNGSLAIEPGTTGSTPYIEFYTPGGVRCGYIGYALTGINIVAENGPITLNGTVAFIGAIPTFSVTSTLNCGTAGKVQIAAGDNVYSGLVAFIKSSGDRYAYFGYDTGNDLSLTFELGGKLVINGPMQSTLAKKQAYTVATLPSASAWAGWEAEVTDSSVTTYRSTVSGGGSNRVNVKSNGTDWLVN